MKLDMGDKSKVIMPEVLRLTDIFELVLKLIRSYCFDTHQN